MLEYLYSFIHKEYVVILFDGERLTYYIEKNHKNNSAVTLIEKVRQTHFEMAEKYSWEKIHAN